VPPYLPEDLAVAVASLTRRAAAAARAYAAWMESPLGAEFSLVRQRRAMPAAAP
jgi:hypothetical protein